MRRVESKLHGSSYLIYILTARSRRVDKTLFDLVVADLDLRCDPHAGHRFNPIVSLLYAPCRCMCVPEALPSLGKCSKGWMKKGRAGWKRYPARTRNGIEG